MATLKRKSDFKKNFYEETAWQQDQLVCGVDEVGRGCLAGPLVAAAVIIHTKKISRLIKDSKEMTHDERIAAFQWIAKNCWYAVGITHHRIIDRINIYQATLVTIQKALNHLLSSIPKQPHMILIDAVPCNYNFAGDIIAFAYGESKSVSIAAASIVAKVARDAIMDQLDATFPGYDFGSNKGYATSSHREKMYDQQRTIIHRTTFIDHMNTANTQLNFLDITDESTIW